MKVINPTTITPAMLTSSTAAVPSGTDPAVWAVGTAYNVGDKAYLASTNRIYQCLVANTGASPDVNLTGTTPKWLDWSAVNRWKMFDAEVNTQTLVATPLTVVFQPGSINALALLELSGTQASVSVKNAPGGSVVYSATKSLDGSAITDWYSYFTDPFVMIDSWVMTDIPAYSTCEVTVSITAASGNVYCGVMQCGLWYDLGGTQMGAQVGIIDYSTKKIDAYNRTVLAVGNYSRRLNTTLMMDASVFYKTHKLLVSLRAKPCIWIGTDYDTYSPMVVFGYYKDFAIDVRYPTSVYCSLQVEGLT